VITERTPHQAKLADEVRRFLAAIPDTVHHETLAERFARLVQVQRCMHAAGLAVVSWPERFGGRALSAADAAVVSQELGEGGAPEVINFVALEVVAPALFRYASEEQLAEWLPPMATAERTWCQLFSEPDAGSDLASLRTRARRSGGRWLVTGDKVWSTWAQFADLGLLLARTRDGGRPQEGLTAFVVDLHQPEVEVSPLRTMTGSDEFAQVRFQAAPVEDARVVGAEGQGWQVAGAMLAAERSTYAIRRASVIRGAFVRLRKRATDTHLAGHERDVMIEATIAMEILDLHMAQLVRRLDAGAVPGAEAAITKALLTSAEQSVFAACHAVLGLEGVAWDDPAPPWVEAWLYSRAASIYGGTREIQRNILGERLLGLPREPRPQVADRGAA
jgi:alkylation response protein AidB-like acyl-CoA dehydrogenase